ncbi:hypothetical protein P3T24_000820 [Paraburkholderia sp. GAS33]|jgi:hypothetical protein
MVPLISDAFLTGRSDKFVNDLDPCVDRRLPAIQRVHMRKTASNYLARNPNVSIGDVEPMLLDVVQTLSRANTQVPFVPVQFHGLK